MHPWTWLWRRRDPVLAGLLTTGLLTELLARPGTALATALPLGAVAGAALWWRRSQPIPAFLVCWLALFGLAVAVPDFDNTSVSFVVAFFVAIFSLGAHARGRETIASVVLVVLAIATFGVTDGDGSSPGDVAFATFFVGGPWAAGLALRLRSDLAASHAELKEQQEELTRRAVAEERATIARELHDVVAHAISVTVLQSRGARRQLGRDEDAVRRALDSIEHTNTQALGDMRRLLAILRDTEGEGATGPQPSLARLDDLVEEVRRSGLDVEVAQHGTPGDIPPGVDLSAYRIVQEALTNVLKHAGRARATVRLEYGEDALQVVVRDTGSGAPVPANGSGHGLIGIRERVAVVGGEVATGPEPDGGFAVRARLPYALETS